MVREEREKGDAGMGDTDPLQMIIRRGGASVDMDAPDLQTYHLHSVKITVVGGHRHGLADARGVWSNHIVTTELHRMKSLLRTSPRGTSGEIGPPRARP